MARPELRGLESLPLHLRPALVIWRQGGGNPYPFASYLFGSIDRHVIAFLRRQFGVAQEGFQVNRTWFFCRVKVAWLYEIKEAYISVLTATTTHYGGTSGTGRN